MTVLYTGRAVPFDGKRVLTGKEAQQRAKAMACLRKQSIECQGQVHVGIFFDGTGNNQTWKQDKHTLDQRQRNKHSNVARLWEAHLADANSGFYRYYIPGVGTPFKELGDTHETLTAIGGNGFAFMGADRINWGITNVFNAINDYLVGIDFFSTPESQRKVVNLMSAQMLTAALPIVAEGGVRWSMLTAAEELLRTTVKAHPKKLKILNVSIYGFSRGAAEARACAHWMQQIFERKGGGFEIAGVPIRINFLGIFDTVASVGIGDITPVTFGHSAWAEGTQSIHPVVEQCAHFVALHEQRASFPLEAATGRGNTGYPGMHSDVGGGYCPGEQGKAMPAWGKSPHLSQIPLLDMHFAALKAGVPMKTIEEIRADSTLAASYATDTKLISAYNNWLENSGVKPGSLTKFTQAHTEQYLRWRGMLHSGGKSQLQTKRFYKESDATDRADLLEADTNLGITLRSWRERRAANETFLGRAREVMKDAVHYSGPAGLFVEAGKSPLSSHESKFLDLMMKAPVPPAASIQLFEEYIHDSRAGFRPLPGFHEPAFLTGGYARYRNVFLQSNSEERLPNLANEALEGVRTVGNEAIAYFQWLYKVAEETYAAARAEIYRKKQQAKRLASEVATAVAAEAEEVAEDLRVWQEEKRVELHKSVDQAAANAHRDADRAARIYYQAEKKILLQYIKAEKHWRQLLEKEWAGDSTPVKKK